VEDVAGYRVLRSVGHGDRARLLLGFDDGHTVVLKVCAAGDPLRHTEIEALCRAAGDHVVRLDDVASDGRDAVLVLERLPGGTLAELLDRRGTLGAGEAVTILAPIAATIDRLHASGVAHRALSLTSVCFREDGAPTLTGFGHAELFAPGSPEVVRETVAGVIADRAALGDITGVVLGRVAGERAPAAVRLAHRLPEVSLEALGRALFDLATPTPVRFDAEPAEVETARLGAPQETADVEEEAPGLLPTGIPPGILALIPDGIRERVAEVVDRGRRLWSAWPSTRRRLALGVTAGGLTVVVAVALVPPAPAGPTAAQPTPIPSASIGEPVSGLPDDPVAAAAVLLELRDRCVRDLSLLCLDDVVQAGSAAHDQDVELIRALQEGRELPEAGILAGAPVLVERLGDSALLDLPAGSQPRSVLLLRTTNGWRIRQYLNQYPDVPAVSTGGDEP
jgi:hypothetical protein